MSDGLKICFVASEVAPFAKTGGLADVASSLPAELTRRGHDVRVFMPYYRQVDRGLAGEEVAEGIRDVGVELGPRTYHFSAVRATLTDGRTPLYLIDCGDLYQRGALYTQDADEAQRFAVFARAAIECCQRLAFAPDVFHCNDWHTALLPLLLRTIYEWDSMFRPTGTLMTVHNLGYQGVFPAEVLGSIGLERWSHLFDQEDLAAGRLNYLRTGLIYADHVSTVSPTYAREIQTPEFGMGLDPLLRARRSRLHGILNGVDYASWSPESDAYLPHRYSREDLAGKARNKRELIERLHLAPAPDAPLLGIVSRLAHQKGFDLAFDVLPDLLARRDVRLVVLGTGERRYEEFFERLQDRFPDRVCYHRGYHEELAHLVEAAADMFVMPSRYEPCGLNQMFSLRYGTIPVVRRTGGLADSVRPVDGRGGGTGFVFEHFAPDGLRWALGAAIDHYADRAAWGRIVRNAMAEDFSWQAQADPYVELYRRIAAS